MKTLEEFMLFINPRNLLKRGYSYNEISNIYMIVLDYVAREVELHTEELRRIKEQEKEAKEA